MQEEKKRKIYTAEQAWLKACKWCAFQERNQQEVRNKLYDYGLYSSQVEELISKLITEGFLNEERFAVAYAGGKFRILGWGKEKIKIALKQKKISEYCIKKALGQIDDRSYQKKLEEVIAKRSKEEKEKTPYKRKYKIAQYALSRGFESDLIWEILKEED